MAGTVGPPTARHALSDRARQHLAGSGEPGQLCGDAADLGALRLIGARLHIRSFARWVHPLGRGKRLRLAFFNVAARVISHGRRIYLRFRRAYRHVEAFIGALAKLRALPFVT